jgi:hypothetical protein
MFDAWIHEILPRTIVNAFREAGWRHAKNLGRSVSALIAPPRKSSSMERDPDSEEGIGAVGKGRVALIEKSRPNADV